ncbi:hypothetical protein BT69DRAFT_1036034 [Atractiella rhizophila]|nr:hypothetical protein BT69DRAFT_1036034 [Atractiella rhizophila]
MLENEERDESERMEVDPKDPSVDSKLDGMATNKNGYWLDENLMCHLNPQYFMDSRGGILCDEMGTGKTFISLALIMSTKGSLADITDVQREAPFFPKPVVLSDLSASWGFKEYVEERSKVGFEDVTHAQEQSKVRIPSLRHLAAHRLLCSGRETNPLEGVDKERMRGMEVSNVIKELESNPPYYFLPYVSRLGYTYNVNPTASISSTRTPTPTPKVRGQPATPEYRKLYVSKTNLVIVPSNLVVQWKEEIAKHIVEGELKVFVWAKKALPSAEELIKYDVVLMSDSKFSTLEGRSEAETVGRDELADIVKIHWKRIMVDEGHTLGGSNKLVTLVQRLHAQSKFIITGTPSNNLLGYQSITSASTAEDGEVDENSLACEAAGDRDDFDKLGRMVGGILNLEPFCFATKGKTSNWKVGITDPYLVDGMGSGRLFEILSRVMVRNRPEDVARDVKLPPLSKNVIKLPFNPIQRLTYNVLLALFAVNSVTSQRTDIDYIFHPRRQKELAQLMTNLHLSHLYFGSDELVENTKEALKNGQDSLRRKGSTYSSQDRSLLSNALACISEALDSKVWTSSIQSNQIGFAMSRLPEMMSTFDPLKEKTLLLPQEQVFIGNEDIIKLRKMVHEVLMEGAWEDEDDFWEEFKTTTAKERYDAMMYGVEEIPPKKKHPTALSSAMPMSTKMTTANPGSSNQSPLPSSIADARILTSVSAKANYLVNRIKHEPKEKFLLFSSNPNNIFHVAQALSIAGIPYIYYLGKGMQRSEREAAAHRFQTDPQCKILLVELRWASHGVNLCKATRIIFLEPVWSPDTEAQAIKRGHRIGQTKEVRVEILCMKDSFEEAMIERKKEMSKKDFEDTAVPQDDTRLRALLQNATFIPQSACRDYALKDTPLILSISQPYLAKSLSRPIPNNERERIRAEMELQARKKRKVEGEGDTRRWRGPLSNPLYNQALHLPTNGGIELTRLGDLIQPPCKPEEDICMQQDEVVAITSASKTEGVTSLSPMHPPEGTKGVCQIQ